MSYRCTNPEGCKGDMEDRGNYLYCLRCGTLEFKLHEQDSPWEPLPKQQVFLYAPKKYTLYVGGVGSGKTMAGGYKAIMKGVEHPGGQGVIGAQVFPQLRDATMKTFFEICPAPLMWKGDKNKAFNKTEGILTMSNEFQHLFRPLYDPEVLKSLNLVYFWIDEGTDVSPDIFYQLQSRLRSRYGYMNGEPAHQGWVTSNPNGHDWLWQWFVAQSDEESMYVTAPTKENKYLPPGFEEGLRRRWPEAWVKRFLDGSFDVFEGQIYPMLDVNIHGRMEALHFFLHDIVHKIPGGWPVFISLDHGVTNPTAVGFYTVDPDENVYKFDELYESNKPVSYHAYKIREKLAYWGIGEAMVSDWLIDPSTKGQRGMEGRAVMAEYHDQGLPFRPANNQVQAGILQVVEYLMPNPITNQPKFFIHPRCKNTWREMGNYKWKKRPSSALMLNEPEEPAKSDDHTCDETRYFLMTRPKIDLLKVASSYHMMLKSAQQKYLLDGKKLPHALQSDKPKHGVGRWPNW